MRIEPFLIAIVALAPGAGAGPPDGPFEPDLLRSDAFRQLEEILPTPSRVRTASGAPGPDYWQQKVDYEIDVTLDDEAQRIVGSETITYTNRSPDTLEYLWLQLDPNLFSATSDRALATTAPDFETVDFRTIRRLLARETFDGGMTVTAVTDAAGSALAHTVVKTMMRVDLERPLASGGQVRFRVDWHYDINDGRAVGGRTGYEHFEDDGNYLYEIAQWFPRLAAYTDVNGWQHKQYLGSGEFTLEFGDYLVRLDVPADHVVAATGVLQNPAEVLSPAQRRRLEQARHAEDPLFVITPEEALANQSSRSSERRTWIFRADDVRDFAFASSRKFIWDAIGHAVGGRRVMAMSFYPPEGEPLWSRYSTHAIVHTLDVYSRFTFDYPYPVAISVNGPVGGMEYPMICFNGPRPEPDGTYTPRTKYGLISVIIHEVGHNWFPMIVNSDERQWTWMDEGLNTFVQFLAEQEWQDDYPARRGEARDIVEYMTSAEQVPIMTNSESLLQFGNNAYAKPATALNVLRETVLGRELFDFAFKTYATRWQFKRPQPSDLFRTMEDASGVDLDWFWRGWFYSTDHVDLAIEGVRLYTIDSRDPDVEKPYQQTERDAEPESLTRRRNESLPRRASAHPELKDFYNEWDELDVTPGDRAEFEELLGELEPHEREILLDRSHFYAIDLANRGGLVMPAILEVEYDDGTVETLRIPAELWRKDSRRAAKLLITDRLITRLALDPHLETADADLTNNHFPPRPVPSRFRIFKEEQEKNPMQKAREREAPPGADEGGGG